MQFSQLLVSSLQLVLEGNMPLHIVLLGIASVTFLLQATNNYAVAMSSKYNLRVTKSLNKFTVIFFRFVKTLLSYIKKCLKKKSGNLDDRQCLSLFRMELLHSTASTIVSHLFSSIMFTIIQWPHHDNDIHDHQMTTFPQYMLPSISLAVW